MYQIAFDSETYCCPLRTLCEYLLVRAIPSEAMRCVLMSALGRHFVRSAFFFVASFLLQVFGSLVVALMGSSSRSAATTVGGAASDLRGG